MNNSGGTNYDGGGGNSGGNADNDGGFSHQVATSSPTRLSQSYAHDVKMKPSPRRASTFNHTPPRNAPGRGKSHRLSVNVGANSYTDQTDAYYNSSGNVDQVEGIFDPQLYVKWEGGEGGTIHPPSNAPLGYGYGYEEHMRGGHSGRHYQIQPPRQQSFYHPHQQRPFHGHHPTHSHHHTQHNTQFNSHNNRHIRHNHYPPPLAPTHPYSIQHQHHNHPVHHTPSGQMLHHPPSFTSNSYPPQPTIVQPSQPPHHHYQVQNHHPHVPPPMGQPLNPNAPIWQPPNVGPRCNIQPPLLHHPIHINNNNEASSMQRANQRNLSSQSAIMDHTSNLPTHALSSSDFLTQLHPGFQQMGEYVLIDCTVVHGGEDVGYLKPFNDAEKRVMYTDPKNAMVPKYIPQSVSETTPKYSLRMDDEIPSQGATATSCASCFLCFLRALF